MAFTYPVRFASVLEVRTATSTNLHAAANATFTLYIAGTNTPATIYSSDTWTVANTTGTVTTDASGNYSVLLDPQYQYQLSYKGTKYLPFAVGEDSRESESDLATHAALTSGVHGAAVGDPLASQTWVQDAITAVVAPNVAVPDATTSVKGKVQLAGDLRGTAAAPVIESGLRGLITGALQTTQVGVASGAASLDGSGKVPTAQLPSTGTTPDSTTSTKGIVQLAGDLAGTAAAPVIESTLKAKINGAQQTTAKGVANGYAGLDAGGLVPTAQLPTSYTGAFANQAISNYRDTWITVTGTTYAATAAESGCIYKATNAAGCTFSFPKTAPVGCNWTVQQSSAVQDTMTCADTSNGSFIVNADSQFKTRKQNSEVTVRCISNVAGNNAGFNVTGDYGA